MPLQGFNVIYTKTTPLLDEGTFSFSYQSNGKLQRVTYPGQQGTEDYSYDSEGRLQSIEFPDDSILSFTRTGRLDLASAQFTDTQNTVYRYDFTYDDQAQLISSNYSIDSLQMESWSYYWGPQGLEYASRSGGQAITQNFSTDPSGRILSMSYGSASYSGELYFHYDALGNTTLLTDAGGNPKASFIYDLHTGKILDSWNPDNLVVINLNQGIGGNLGFELPEGNKVYIPSAKHRLKTPFELYLEMQRMRYADGSPLLSGDQSPVFWDGNSPSTHGGILVSWWSWFGWIISRQNGTYGGGKSNCTIEWGDSCEEIWQKYKSCGMGKSLILTDSGCRKIARCWDRINKIKQKTPHCLESNWNEFSDCLYYLGMQINGSQITWDTRFVRGMGEHLVDRILYSLLLLMFNCNVFGLYG